MKPRAVELQAFGPYLQKTTIDFSKLYANGLFLITGPTGCGKTTILDAMSYALYGRAAGSVRDARDMRSTRAPDSLATRVALDFDIGAQGYRFERSIRIREVKKRTGMVERTTDYTEDCYVREGDAWKLLCSGTQVRDKAEELLGFSHEQFSQVVVLPQGEFRRLLIAQSSEKQKILEALFNTARWQDFSKALAKRTKEVTDRLSRCAAAGAALCASVDCENARSIEALCADVTAQDDALAQALLSLTSAHGAAQTALQKAQALAAQFAELDALREKAAQLTRQSDAVAKKRDELTIAEKAVALLPYFDALRASQAALDTAVRDEKAARRLLGEATEQNAGAQNELAGCGALEARQKELDLLTARLESVLSPARALCAACAELDTRQKTAAKLTADAAAQKERLDALLTQSEKRRAELTRLDTQYVSRLAQLVAEQKELEARAELFETLTAQEKTVAQLEKALEKKRAVFSLTRQTLRNEKATLEQMQASLDADAAYRLACALRADEPCPVCGSPSHPSPAAACFGAPAKEEIDRQKKIVEALEEQLKTAGESGAQARGECDAAESRRAELAARCAAFGDGGELPARLASLSKEVAAAQAAAKQKQTLEALETKETQAIQSETERFEALKSGGQQAALTVSMLEGRITQLSDAVPEGERDADAVLRRITAQKEESAALSQKIQETRGRAQQTASTLAAAGERLRAAEKNTAAAAAALAAAQTEYEKRRAESGLAPQADIAALSLSPQAIADLRAALEAFDREAHLCRDKTATLEAALAQAARPDMQKLRAEEAAAREQKETALSQKGALLARKQSLLNVRAQLSANAKEEEALREQFSLFDRISRLAGGENPLKTPIHQFVLGLMLDDIVSDANLHLKQLSRGRYSLVRSAAASRGNGTRGLDLGVLDAWSGGERAVSTLSGGEMFLASLSLAFGLSDVVQSYAGGIRLDSLFIDEGFGSLDTETLDTAMGALERIRLSGRLIGVISHVSDLRERIGARIDVTRTADGTASASVTAL